MVSHAFIVAGVLTCAIVFALMSVGNPVQALMYSAVIASCLVAAGFGMSMASILRNDAPSSADSSKTPAGDAPRADYRIAFVAAWLVISLVAAISDLAFGSPPDVRRAVSTLGFACLIGLFASQAFRVAKMEQRLQRS